jgi:hypothetical protein
LAQKSVNVQYELETLAEEKRLCLLRAKALSTEHNKVWKQEIRRLADILEREYVLLEQNWLISTISAQISRLYMEQDIPIWQTVHRYLDSKYKEEEQSSVQSSTVIDERIEQETVKMLQQLHKHIGEIPRAALPELIEFADKFSKAGRKRSALEHIALGPNDQSSFADQINDSKEIDREHVTIDRPVPHGSLMFDAITRKIARWQSVQQRVFEFPPEILEKDEEYSDALDVADVWMDPILDLKYSKCLPDWLKAESYRDVYGKHAAGVMSYSVTNLCKHCTDEKTKEWVRMEPKYAITHSTFECLQCNNKVNTVCPTCMLPMRESQKPMVGWQCPECEGTEALRRNLTREQIGDKSSIIMDIAERFLAKIPDAAAFCNWYREWLEQRVSGRKSRLSSDLSERA